NENPVYGNLSSSINREMVPGSGPFTVQMQFNSTQNGTILLQGLLLSHVPGASNLDLPTQPILIEETIPSEIASNLISPFVGFQWNATSSHNLSTFLEYEIFRTGPGETLNLLTPYSSSLESMFIDQGLSVGTYDYYVRASHENGIQSNLSDELTITIDPPPPDTTPPLGPTNVSASDVPSDQGGHLLVNWTDSVSIDTHHHLVFVDTLPFSNVSTRNPVANLSVGNSSIVVTNTSDRLDNTGAVADLGSSIIDNTDLYVAVVAVDLVGNFDSTVASVGPVRTFNDTSIGTSLSLSVVTPSTLVVSGSSLPAAGRGDSVLIDVILSMDGSPASGETVNLLMSDGTIQISIDGTTNSQGKATFVDGNWGNLLDTDGRLLGEVQLTSTFSERTESSGGQTILGSVTTASMVSTASSIVSAVQSSIELDSDDAALVRLQVSTEANDISLIEGLPFLWTLGNATNGVSSSNGISTVQANGFVEKNVDYPGGGEIVFDYDSENAPFWMFMSPSSVTIDLLPFPEENNNGGGQNSGNNTANTIPDPELISLSIDCGETQWSIPDNSSKWLADENIRSCSMINSNEVTVFVEMDLDLSVQGVEIDGDLGSSFSLFSNETRSLKLTLRDSGSFRDGTIELSFEITAPDYIQNSSEISLNFSFTSDEVQADPSNSNDLASSSDNSIIIVGAISVGVILALAIGVILLRRSGSGEDEEDEEDDSDGKMGSIPLAVSGDASQTGFDSDIPKGVPLDELMKQGKRPAPVSMKGRRKLTEKEEEEPEVEEEEEPEVEEEEEPEVEEEDYTKSEDYHVDDDGTEWWKDELGVWWWRGPDDEEWSEYSD
ncbi:MAG: hypothetical protein VYB83_03900, partial [Candidatus Thermoplasmatota archaeon]|nr:hypothetical protein [Candidatus Thermoplasmatota archaeon]